MSDESAVPPEVEELLLGNMAAAGATGGGVSGGAGARGGASGGRAGGKMLKTKVVRERASCPGGLRAGVGRVVAAYPKAVPADPGTAGARFAVPLGIGGLQMIVVDLRDEGDEVAVTAYGKEGLISRKPTAKTAAGVAEALRGA